MFFDALKMMKQSKVFSKKPWQSSFWSTSSHGAADPGSTDIRTINASVGLDH